MIIDIEGEALSIINKAKLAPDDDYKKAFNVMQF